MAGGIDLTLVALKIRIDAAAAIISLSDPATDRHVVATYLSLSVTFPTPIVLFSTGLGLYGLSGLFAMHFQRLEDAPDPTSAVGPALAWLIKAEGEPTHLKNGSNQWLWGPKFDHWAFGVGVMIGTLDSGIIANFHGMFILELPGPRILITVNIKIIQPPPGLNDTSQITTGILGVIDLDFNRHTLTVNVLISYDIKDVLSIKLPIEIFFNLQDGNDWHLYLGTNTQPASADILGIVKGGAYLMISGKDLAISQLATTFPGVALAVGIRASMTLGDESIDIYLRIAAQLDVGLSFSPFLIVGKLKIEGELKLVIVSIGADAEFDLISNGEHTRAWGQVCGHVKILFFKISACVSMSIGDPDVPQPADPPSLVGGVYLQSFSPALLMGQGAGKPIDASLGDAFEDGVTAASKPEPLVPIDSIPVIQFKYTPLAASGLSVLGTALGQASTLRAPDGAVAISGGSYIRYQLSSISLSYDGMGSDSPFIGSTPPPATWRPNTSPGAGGGATNNVDLALFSTCPSGTERALVRSTDLYESINDHWADLCKPPAPPPCVLYTFCGKPDGPSPNGWVLKGIAQPDPPDTKRTEPVNDTLKIEVAPQIIDDATAELLRQMSVGVPQAARIISLLYPVKPVNHLGKKSHTPAKDHLELMDYIRTQIDERVWGPEKLVKSAKETFDNPFEHKGTRGYRGCWTFKTKEKKLEELSNPISRVLKLRNDKGKSMPLRVSIALFLNGQAASNISLLTDGVHSGLALRGLYLIEFAAPVVAVHLKCWMTRLGAVVAAAYDGLGNIVDAAYIKEEGQDKTNIRANSALAHDFVLYGEGIRHVLLYGEGNGILTGVCVDKHAENACLRGLQLPYSTRSNPKLEENILAENKSLAERLKKARTGEYIILDTGYTKEAILLVACLKGHEQSIVIEELHDDTPVKAAYTPATGDIHPLSSAADMPAPMKAKPWKDAAATAYEFVEDLAGSGFQAMIISIKPEKETNRIRLQAKDDGKGNPELVIGAIAICPRVSPEEKAVLNSIHETQVSTLSGYLNATTAPLLKPGKRYNIAVSYDAFFRDKNGTETAKGSHTQTFHFRTDNEAPKTLDGHVLGVWPNAGEAHHFYEEPVQVYFNDDSVFALYSAYGKQLQMIMRGADGKPVTGGDDGDSPTQSSAVIDEGTLSQLPGFVKTPYRELLEQVAEENGLKGCAGDFTSTNHTVLTSPFKLRPNLSYILDIEIAGETPTDDPHRPLFRAGFTTSRYATMQAFADDLKTLRVYQVPLQAAPAFGTFSGATAFTDIDIEQKLHTAGFSLSADPKETKMIVLWAPFGAPGHFQPWGLMIDAAEPMWRQREIAVLDPVAQGSDLPPDPMFKAWKAGYEDALIVSENSPIPIVTAFIKSTGGTRTIALLNQALLAGGNKTLGLQLETTANTDYQVSQSAAAFATLSLTNKAPWEE